MARGLGWFGIGMLTLMLVVASGGIVYMGIHSERGASTPTTADPTSIAPVSEPDNTSPVPNNTSAGANTSEPSNASASAGVCTQYCANRTEAGEAINASCMPISACTDGDPFTSMDGAPCSSLSVCCCRSVETDVTQETNVTSSSEQNGTADEQTHATASDCQSYCETNGFSGATDTTCVTVFQCSGTVKTRSDGAPCDGTAVCCCQG